MNKQSRIDRARKAGSSTSAAKVRAARKNGRRGGRPGNPEIKRIMKQRGVTRQRAHKILAERRRRKTRTSGRGNA